MAEYDISGSIQDYLKAYNVPSTGDAGDLATKPAEANIQNAPNLEKLSDIVNRINQQAQQTANLARTGGSGALDQQILGNIGQMAQGYVSPETVREAEVAAAGQWGGRGFGVDTPAWQSAVRRTLGLQREALQSQAGKDYESYLASHPSAPIFDVSKALVTPELYSTAQARRAEEALKAAQLQEQRRQAEATLALQQSELAQKQAQYESGLGWEQQKFAEEMALKEAQMKQQQVDALAALYAQAYQRFYQPFRGSGTFRTPQEAEAFSRTGQAEAAAAARRAAAGAVRRYI